MELLHIDAGAVEYRISGGGALRFNPADPNLYSRFMTAGAQLEKIEKDLLRQAKDTSPEQMVALLKKADTKMKQLLDGVFGGDNDFDKALGGISLMARGGNGKTVAENLFSALETVLEKGAKALVDARVAEARGGL